MCEFKKTEGRQAHQSHSTVFILPVQSRTQAEEDVALAVDGDGFMESFFRRVGFSLSLSLSGHARVRVDSTDVLLVGLGGRGSRTH